MTNTAEHGDTIRALAPHGALRVALNHGNAVLVHRTSEADTPTGVSVDLAQALARRLGLEATFQHYSQAGAVAAGAATDTWDLCFLAIDPVRAETIAFSAPYVAIEGNYLVPQDSAAQSAEDVDQLGLRVGMVTGSAYSLHLIRAASGARLVSFDTADAAAAALAAGELDALSGVRQAMDRRAATHPGWRVIDTPFMQILQAVGVPKDRARAASFVAAFIHEMKEAGFVADALARSGHGDVTVP